MLRSAVSFPIYRGFTSGKMHSFCLEGGLRLSRSALGLRSGRSRPRIRRLLLITPRAPLVEPLEMRSSAVLALAMAAGAHATEMKLAVDSSGAYTVSVGGEAWFTSAATAYTSGHKTLSTADGSLKLQGSTKGTGSDASGKYASTTLTWDSGAFVTEFREYNSMIVFEQRFPQGVQGKGGYVCKVSSECAQDLVFSGGQRDSRSLRSL